MHLLTIAGTQGLIFVVDSSDTARLGEARLELHKIINDREMKEALLLVFANKQDTPGRKSASCDFFNPSLILGLCTDLSPEEITNALQLNKLKDRLWYVVPSVATEGTGIFEGLVSTSHDVCCKRTYSLRPGSRITSRPRPLPNKPNNRHPHVELYNTR
jgi:ADP-ribosylation factor protein 6